MTVSIDDLAATVTAMSVQIASLLAAVNVQKSYIDAASQIAVSGITGSSGSATPAVGKSPVGNSGGVFSGAWVDPATDIRAVSLTAGGTDTRFTSFLSTPTPATGSTPVKVAQLGIAETIGSAYAGNFGWYTSTGHGSPYAGGYKLYLRAADVGSNSETASLLTINGYGQLGLGMSNPGCSLDIETAVAGAYQASSSTQGLPDAVTRVTNIVGGAAGPAAIHLLQVAAYNTAWYHGTVSTTANYGGVYVIGRQTGATSYQEFSRIDADGNLLIGATAMYSGQSGLQVGNALATTLANENPCSIANAAAACLKVGSMTSGRSISTSGTINASGADYAEYMYKAEGCGVIAKGQIVGIDVEGHVTDKWADAIGFGVKTTKPSVVGGDDWGDESVVGKRPETPMRTPDETEQQIVSEAIAATDTAPAIDAVYRTVIIRPGDTDREWATKEADHAAAMAVFDAALDAARQTVDRISFCGQVPVNVRGAVPGQYIVPVQANDGDGIAGIAMVESDITLAQYMRAVGKVIAIEADGRARIIVKVA